MALRSTPAQQEKQLKKIENRYLTDPQAGLALLASLIATVGKDLYDERQKQARGKLAELKRLIAGEFGELCKQDNLPNEAEMHGKLNEAIIELEELVSFSALANKTVVGIGGGFSAGKSTFINSLIGKDLLPSKVTPTTAIPTYLALGEAEEIRAVNIFGNAVPIDREAVNALCHDFRERHDVQPKSFIKFLTITTPDFPYRHLTFVDTPGYSNANGESISDRQVALDQLRLAEVLIWVMDIATGTLRQSDIEFIKEARELDEAETLPILVVLNQADNIEPGAVQQVVDEVKEKLQRARIDCSGIVAYDSLSGSELARSGANIGEYLEKIGRIRKPCRLPRRFAQVFEAYALHNKDEEVRHSGHLKFFNEFKIRMSDQITADENTQLGDFIRTLQRQIGAPKGLVAQFESLGHKVEKLLDDIFALIRVEDQDAEPNGVPGIVRVRDGKILCALKTGDTLDGSVAKKDPFGIYVSCGIGDSVLIFKEDLIQQPAMDSPCMVQITDIHPTNGDVKVVVIFGTGV